PRSHHLRSQNRPHSLCAFRRDEPVRGDACRVHDPMDLTEAMTRPGEDATHVFLAADISDAYLDLCACGLEPPPELCRISFRSASHEDEAGAMANRERLGERSADASEASGDQIDAGGPNLRVGCGTRADVKSLEGAHPSVLTSVGHDVLADAAS